MLEKAGWTIKADGCSKHDFPRAAALSSANGLTKDRAAAVLNAPRGGRTTAGEPAP